MATAAEPPSIAVQSRVFDYRTTTEWRGRRNGHVQVPGKASVPISSPPEFRGDGDLLNPEELLLSAVETCLMLTFVALAEKHHLPVEAYCSETTGRVQRTDAEYRFTLVTIRPTIIISDRDAATKTLMVLQKAERDCLISNSIRAEVRVEPEVILSAVE